MTLDPIAAAGATFVLGVGLGHITPAVVTFYKRFESDTGDLPVYVDRLVLFGAFALGIAAGWWGGILGGSQFDSLNHDFAGGIGVAGAIASPWAYKPVTRLVLRAAKKKVEG